VADANLGPDWDGRGQQSQGHCRLARETANAGYLSRGRILFKGDPIAGSGHPVAAQAQPGQASPD
jgi:hypothetical protein